ncbi:hypothetical protein L580_4175 [Serratia fonticola AU-P3(3)]|nr:hypothetical protein L580_4175 [Serratia fonticola AU-P3(3)]
MAQRWRGEKRRYPLAIVTQVTNNSTPIKRFLIGSLMVGIILYLGSPLTITGGFITQNLNGIANTRRVSFQRAINPFQILFDDMPTYRIHNQVMKSEVQLRPWCICACYIANMAQLAAKDIKLTLPPIK